jgi:hypothetical protein
MDFLRLNGIGIGHCKGVHLFITLVFRQVFDEVIPGFYQQQVCVKAGGKQVPDKVAALILLSIFSKGCIYKKYLFHFALFYPAPVLFLQGYLFSCGLPPKKSIVINSHCCQGKRQNKEKPRFSYCILFFVLFTDSPSWLALMMKRFPIAVFSDSFHPFSGEHGF